MLIYFLYFRADGGSLENALKILKGLRGNTFNYLSQEQVRRDLLVDKEVPIFSEPINSINFFSQCVRLNRPCVFEDLAKQWNSSIESMGGLGDPEVEVYKQPETTDPDTDLLFHRLYSFKNSTKIQTTYHEFT
jgi:hypothetical protein